MGRDLVEGTIDTLLSAPNLTKQDVKLAFASLTIALALPPCCWWRRRLSKPDGGLLGGAFQADTAGS